MEGMVNTPVATTLPIAEPEIIPNRLEAMTAILPEPPVDLPAIRCPILIKVSAPPVPARIALKMLNIASMTAERPSMVPQIPVPLW